MLGTCHISLLFNDGAEQKQGNPVDFQGGRGGIKFSKNISTLQNFSPFASVY